MNKECRFCGGSGQVSFFKGVSRFLLSVEECPECMGLGYILPPDPETKSCRDVSPKVAKGKAKKKKA